MEVGCHHIIFRAHTDDIGVGEISIQHWITVGAVALIAPAFRIYLHQVGTGIGLIRQDAHILKAHVAGMAHKESLGGQVAPHRGFRIGFLLLIGDGIVDFCQLRGLYTPFMVEGDVG